MKERILKNGMILYRYDFGCVPENWSTYYKSKIYVYEEGKEKNKIGAFFFFDNEDDMLNTCKQVIEQKKNLIKHDLDNGNVYGTKTYIKENIRLLDLTIYNDVCELILDLYKKFPLLFEKDIIFKNPYTEYGVEAFLYKENLNNKEDEWRLSSLRDCLEGNNNLRVNVNKKLFYGNHETDFAYVCQQLTDFDNGCVFKEVLEANKFEGYMFCENGTITYCLFDSGKMELPRHKKIVEKLNDIDFMECDPFEKCV